MCSIPRPPQWAPADQLFARDQFFPFGRSDPFFSGALSPFSALLGDMFSSHASPFGPLLSSAPLLSAALQREPPRVLAMKLDLVETDGEYRVLADLPGVAMGDIKIDIDAGNVLRISAEKSDSQDEDVTQGGVTYHRSERSTGRQVRYVQLPANTDAARVAARVEHGVLTVVAPKIEGLEAGGRRRIAVQAAGTAAPSVDSETPNA